jgi:hypothetical protein
MDPLTSFEAAGFTVEIHIDENCDSPRAFDPLGTIVGWHRRYELTDNCTDSPQSFATPADFHAYLRKAKPPVVLPLYLLDHSGVALSTTDFRDPWDSGQVGYIYATAKAIKSAFCADTVSSATLDAVRKILVAEVANFGAYLNGECYGYILRDAAGAEVDACWGFIGRENVEAAARESASASASSVPLAASAHG